MCVERCIGTGISVLLRCALFGTRLIERLVPVFVFLGGVSMATTNYHGNTTLGLAHQEWLHVYYIYNTYNSTCTVYT